MAENKEAGEGGLFDGEHNGDSRSSVCKMQLLLDYCFLALALVITTQLHGR
jgi:hypothetical protein